MVANGGVADLYIMVGYDPKMIVVDYWNYIVGKPVLPPAYALGWN
jgi:alpha-glucosidase (family GH31 glycosyl hydrolase)